MEAELRAEITSALALVDELSTKSSDSGLSEDTCWELFGGPCPEALRKKMRNLEEKESSMEMFASTTSQQSLKVEEALITTKQSEEVQKESSNLKLEDVNDVKEQHSLTENIILQPLREQSLRSSKEKSSFSSQAIGEKLPLVKESKLGDLETVNQANQIMQEEKRKSLEFYQNSKQKANESSSIKERHSSQTIGEKKDLDENPPSNEEPKLGDPEAIKQTSQTQEEEKPKSLEFHQNSKQKPAEASSIKQGHSSQAIGEKKDEKPPSIKSKLEESETQQEKVKSLESELKVIKEPLNLSQSSREESTMIPQSPEPKLMSTIGIQRNGIHSPKKERLSGLSDKCQQTVAAMVKNLSTSVSALSVIKLSSTSSESSTSFSDRPIIDKPCNCCCCIEQKIKLSRSSSSSKNFKNYKINIYTNNDNDSLNKKECPVMKITSFSEDKAELNIKKHNKRLQTSIVDKPEKIPVMHYPYDYLNILAPPFCTCPLTFNTRKQEKNIPETTSSLSSSSTTSYSSKPSCAKYNKNLEELVPPPFRESLRNELQRRNNVKRAVDKFENRCRAFSPPYEQREKRSFEEKSSSKRQPEGVICNCCNNKPQRANYYKERYC